MAAVLAGMHYGITVAINLRCAGEWNGYEKRASYHSRQLA